ncbi:MAG: hypothetical protein QW165_02475 [Candidatus Woesearchaeota archaeon]
MKTGAYASRNDYWSRFFDKEQFMGINCEGFHDWVTRHANKASNAISEGYVKTRNFVGKRWYLMAVPVALSVGIAMYSGLMAIQPDTGPVQMQNVKKRKKGHIDYWMKYYFRARQKASELTGTLDEKVE